MVKTVKTSFICLLCLENFRVTTAAATATTTETTVFDFCLTGGHFSIIQGGHKPRILRDFSEYGKLRELSGNFVQSH